MVLVVSGTGLLSGSSVEAARAGRGSAHRQNSSCSQNSSSSQCMSSVVCVFVWPKPCGFFFNWAPAVLPCLSVKLRVCSLCLCGLTEFGAYDQGLFSRATNMGSMQLLMISVVQATSTC
jgi:hypothetical protein